MGHSASGESAQVFSKVDILFNFRTLGTSFDVHSGSVPVLVSSSLQAARIRVNNPVFDGRPVGTKEIVDFTWKIFTILNLHEEEKKDFFVQNVTCLEVVDRIRPISATGNRDLKIFCNVHYTIAQAKHDSFLSKLARISKHQSTVPKGLDFQVNFSTTDQLISTSDGLVAYERSVTNALEGGSARSTGGNTSGLQSVAKTASQILTSPAVQNQLAKAATSVIQQVRENKTKFNVGP